MQNQQFQYIFITWMDKNSSNIIYNFMVEFWQPQLRVLDHKNYYYYFFLTVWMLHTDPWCNVKKNVHLQDKEEQKSVVFTSLDKTLWAVMHSILLLSFTFGFSAWRGRKLSERSNLSLFVNQILRHIYSLSWAPHCEHRLAHRGKHTLYFL